MVDTVTGSMEDMIAIPSALVEHVRSRAALGTIIGVPHKPLARPQGYHLLRAAAFPNDPDPNRQAIALLEKVTMLDIGYERAGVAIATRYYFYALYDTGGDTVYAKSEQALDRAGELDPNGTVFLGNLIVLRTDKGERQARLRRRA